MKSNQSFLVIVVVAVLVVVGAMFMMKNNQVPQTAETSAPTASFTMDPSLLIREHSPSKGPVDAKVTIVEFMDPQCEACAQMYPIVSKILADYQGKIRIVYRFMAFHSESLYSGALLLEANTSGKFAQALDIFTKNLEDWGGHDGAKPEKLANYMQEAGIDKMRSERDFVLKKHEQNIRQDEADGEKLGVHGTPTFFVNGVMLPELGEEPLRAAIDQALK